VEYYEESTPWIETVATRSPQAMGRERFEKLVGVAKVLYTTKYDTDIDTEHVANGMSTMMNNEIGVPCDCCLERPQRESREVRQRYGQKCDMQLVPTEDITGEHDGEKTLWPETVATRSPHNMRLETLEKLVGEGKLLYTIKYDSDLDTEDVAVGASKGMNAVEKLVCRVTDVWSCLSGSLIRSMVCCLIQQNRTPWSMMRKDMRSWPRKIHRICGRRVFRSWLVKRKPFTWPTMTAASITELECCSPALWCVL